MSGCNCRSEDPWECESLRWGQPAEAKDTACMCECHVNEKDDDGPTPDEAIVDEEAQEAEEQRHEQPVLGCDCHDCIR